MKESTSDARTHACALLGVRERAGERETARASRLKTLKRHLQTRLLKESHARFERERQEWPRAQRLSKQRNREVKKQRNTISKDSALKHSSKRALERELSKEKESSRERVQQARDKGVETNQSLFGAKKRVSLSSKANSISLLGLSLLESKQFFFRRRQRASLWSKANKLFVIESKE